MREISIDLETYLIGPGSVAPKPVVLSEYDGSNGRLILVDHLASRVAKILSTGNTLVLHNAAFDMSVLWVHCPELRDLIWQAYKDERVKCTQIREKLLELSTSGSLTQAPGYFSLAGCYERYFGEDVSAWKKGDDVWRLRYAELDGLPLEEWPEEAKQYALLDTQWCLNVYKKQEELRNSEGIGSIGTEGLQTFADFVLTLMTVRGIQIDPEHVAQVEKQVNEGLEGPIQILMENGREVVTELKTKTKREFQSYAYEKKDGKIGLRKKLIKEYVNEVYPGQGIYSDKQRDKLEMQGKDIWPALSLSSDGLKALPDDPILNCLRDIAEYDKLKTSFIPSLKRAVEEGDIIHPQYDSLKETGRTSSFGGRLYASENVQQMPRKGAIREAHVARPGYVFVAIDYDALELASLAQVSYDLFGFSKMKDYINAGNDPHCAMGAQLLSVKKGRKISYEEFYEAKNNGDPEAKFYRQMAKAANFGFPGGLGNKTMVTYAQGYGITDMTEEKAGELKENFFETFPEMKAFFNWYPHQQDSQGMYHYDTNGRWRANCSYCSGANGINLQSVSSDGAKAALIKCSEACYFGDLSDCYPVAFIHDENIFEMPDDEYLKERIDRTMTLMIEGMQQVMPDVRIGVGASVMRRWAKDEKEFLFEMNKSLKPRRKTVV